MAGESYGIERQVILPDIPPGLQDPRLVDYLGNLRRMISDSYDELAQRINELSYEAHWGSNTPVQIVANQNNYDLGIAIVHRFSTDASRAFSGFLAPLIEITHIIMNAGSFDLVVQHQNTNSLAVDRVITTTGADVTLEPNDSMIIWYDITTLRWRELHRQQTAAVSGTGTVTSVGLTMPGGFSVANSPVNTAGSLDVTTALDGIIKADGTDFGVVTVGTNLSYVAGTLNATGGGGPVLIENKIFTANATTYNFSTGIDGNTDGHYLLVGKIINNSSSDTEFYLQPNGATTNMQSLLKWFSYAGGETSGTYGGSYNILGFGLTTGKMSCFEVHIHARKNPHSINMNLIYSGTGFHCNDSQNYTWVTGGHHKEYTNLTNFDVLARNADGLGDGSQIMLWKYPQS